MKQIPRKKWNEYIDKLSLIDETAGRKLRAYMTAKGLPETYEATEELIRYANALVMKYGEASAALACEMYDAISMAEGANVPPAEPAPLPEYGETAKAINGTLKKSNNLDYISGAVERLVKMPGADTMLQNAKRDGAEWAWIPNGDSCVFCLTLASRGWQPASKAVLKGGHAEHIHGHCDCTFAIRHDSSTDVAGYDPDKYREMYEKAEGNTSNEKINYLRRMQRAKTNKRYPVTQKQIDDIIDKELNDIEIIKHPEYNSRLRSQGKTTAEMYPWGEVKQIKKIEIGPQSKDTKECLIDTIIHEELEAKIMIESKTNEFYKRIHEMSEEDRHSYINKTIKEFFEKKGWDYGLV